MPDDNEPDTEYTRIRAKMQMGNGIDQRGEVTVETVREVEEDRTTTTVELPDGTVVGDVPINNRAFAEFYHELERSGQALKDKLGIEDWPPEDS